MLCQQVLSVYIFYCYYYVTYFSTCILLYFTRLRMTISKSFLLLTNSYTAGWMSLIFCSFGLTCSWFFKKLCPLFLHSYVASRYIMTDSYYFFRSVLFWCWMGWCWYLHGWKHFSNRKTSFISWYFSICWTTSFIQYFRRSWTKSTCWIRTWSTLLLCVWRCRNIRPATTQCCIKVFPIATDIYQSTTIPCNKCVPTRSCGKSTQSSRAQSSC